MVTLFLVFSISVCLLIEFGSGIAVDRVAHEESVTGLGVSRRLGRRILRTTEVPSLHKLVCRYNVTGTSPGARGCVHVATHSLTLIG
ncbi:hypothetical protein F4678DRAFT_432563 [Xylaria arbuscula]|nr:hypothetical protein F4678DRAFT_432563 [Xylaria arbuscula]